MIRWASVVMMLFALGIGQGPTENAQNENERAPITPENAFTLSLVGHIGYGWINQIAWSPDGTTLAVGSSAGVWLYNTTDFAAEPRFLATQADTWSVVFSADGQLLATGGRDMSVQVWEMAAVIRDPVSATPLHDLHCDVGSWWNHILNLAFDPTGTVLACASDGVMLWDMATGEVRATIASAPNTWGDTHVAFSPDGRTLATAGTHDNTGAASAQPGLVRQWDVQTAELMSSWTLTDGHHVGYAVAYSPDGTQLAVIGRDVTVRDAVTGTPNYTLDTNDDIPRLIFSPTNDILITVGERFVLWDTATGERLAGLASDTMTFPYDYYTNEFGHCSEGENLYPWQPCPTSNEILSAAIRPDGRTVAVAHSTGQITLWDLESREHVATLRGYNFGGAERGGGSSDTVSRGYFAFSPDGTTLAAGASGYITSGGWVELWDLEQQIVRAYLEGDISLRALAYSPDGTLLVTSNGGALQVWDTATNTVRYPQLERGHGEDVTFSPDSTWLAAALDNGPVQIWDVATGDMLADYEEVSDHLLNIAHSPDGTLLAAGDYDGYVHWWNVPQGEHAGTRDAHIGTVHDLVFSPVSHPEGSILALAGGTPDSGTGSVALWMLGAHGSARELARLAPLLDRATSVAFSPDGRLLVAGFTDGSVLLWDATNHEFLATLQGHPSAPFNKVAFNTDGTLLATGGWDGTIRLWGVPEHPSGQ